MGDISDKDIIDMAGDEEREVVVVEDDTASENLRVAPQLTRSRGRSEWASSQLFLAVSIICSVLALLRSSFTVSHRFHSKYSDALFRETFSCQQQQLGQV